jgi:multiple sugar transport system permease protein
VTGTASKAAPPAVSAGGAVPAPPRKRRHYSLLSRRDKILLSLMVGVPTFIHVCLIWLPAFASIVLSLFKWNGVSAPQFIGLKNYTDMASVYPPFWPALQHNLLWLAVFMFIATPLGIFFAVLLDRELRGSRIYQSALYMPVVLSMAIVGFIWQLQYSTSQGFINAVLGNRTPASSIDFFGDPHLNLWAVLVAASWRHVGYIMVLYLAGLKAFDPTLREAASIDGANARQTFFRVVFPVLAPINIVVLVVTVIESLRAFDLVFIINKGMNGLELLSVLITNNILGEASRIGFGSALAVILLLISVGPIIYYLTRALGKPGE